MKRWGIVVGVLLVIAGGIGFWLFKPEVRVRDLDLLSYLPSTAEIAVFQRGAENDWLKLRRSNWFHTLMARPDLKKFAHQQGFDKEELADAERWILDLVGERVLAGYVPNPQLPGHYSLFAFAPIGNRAKRLEIWASLLQHGGQMGFKMTSSQHRGQEVIRVIIQGWPEQVVVKYTKIQGTIVAVLSESENTLEQYLESGAFSADSPRKVAGIAATFSNEFGGWLRRSDDSGQCGFWRGRRGSMAWTLDSAGEGKVRINARASLQSPPPARSLSALTTGSLVKSLPPHPMLSVWGRFSEWLAIVDAFASYINPTFTAPAQQGLVDLHDSAAWVGDRFAISMLPWQPISNKIPVPAPQLAAVLECHDAKAARSAVEGALAQLSAEGGVQLSLTGVERDGIVMDRLTPGTKSLKKQINRWPVMGFGPETMVVAMGEGELRSILARKPAGTTPEPDDCGLSWQVAPTCEAVRGALAAYSLYLMFSGDQPPDSVAPWLPRVDLAVDALSGLQSLEATGTVDGTVARISLEVNYRDLGETTRAGRNK